ncbi:Uncharacterised protein [Mycobacteroides abscessus subsp. abscessus]|nr:Uncharacterised protein [Mycobacteroides abscessus subsp. abscessus]
MSQDSLISPPLQAITLGFVENLHRRQRTTRVGDHRRQHRFDSLDKGFNATHIEESGVVLDAQPQLSAGDRLHGKRVVGGFVADDLIDGESVGPRQHTGVHRIVLEDEQSVEQSFLLGNTMNLTQRNMLVLQRFSVLLGELIQEIRSGGGRADIGAHRHGIDQQANHRFGTRYIRGAAGDHRTKDHVLLSGQRGEQQCPRPLQHRVDRGVLRTRQLT